MTDEAKQEEEEKEKQKHTIVDLLIMIKSA